MKIRAAVFAAGAVFFLTASLIAAAQSAAPTPTPTEPPERTEEYCILTVIRVIDEVARIEVDLGDRAPATPMPKPKDGPYFSSVAAALNHMNRERWEFAALIPGTGHPTFLMRRKTKP